MGDCVEAGERTREGALAGDCCPGLIGEPLKRSQEAGASIFGFELTKLPVFFFFLYSFLLMDNRSLSRVSLSLSLSLSLSFSLSLAFFSLSFPCSGLSTG